MDFLRNINKMEDKILIWVLIIVLVIVILCLIVFVILNREYSKVGGNNDLTELNKISSEPLQELPEVELDCDKNKLQLDDGEMFYEFGNGGFDNNRPSLLLINGGPGATHVYFHELKHLSEKCDINIIMYDQRGCGQSLRNTDRSYSTDELVEDIETLRKHLRIDKLTILGWSFGGYLARAYALKYPSNVSKLIMLSSISAGFMDMQGDEYRTNQRKFIAEAERKRLAEIAKMDIPLDAKIYNSMLNGDWKRQYLHKPDNDIIARNAKFGWDHDEKFRQDILKDLYHDQSRIKDLNIPVLIIEGQHDLTFAPKKFEEFPKHFNNPKVEIFENSAHFVFVDEPERFAETVCTFIMHDSV